MPIRNRTQKHRAAAVFTPLGEDVLLLKRFTGTEHLGRLFEYELELLSEHPDQVDPDKLLGAPMAVRVDLADASPRYFHGMCSRFVQISGDADSEVPVYRATVVPWLWTLTRSADCRIFFDDSRQNTTVPKIVLQVFRDFGASAFRDNLSGTYQGMENCVQYRESAFAFVSRLLEREGIYYFFEHAENGHTLVLADAPTAHEPYPGYETLIYRGRDRAHPGEEHVSRWEVRKQVQPGAVALGGFDFKQPGNDLSVRRSTTRPHDNAAFEWYDYPGSYDVRDNGEHFAAVRLDEFQGEHEVVYGEATTPGLTCGYTFKLAGLPDADGGEFLVTSARYSCVPDAYESSSSGGEQFFRCEFTAIPTRQTFRPARVTPWPMIRGPQTAMVVGPAGEEIHTDEFGRVRVQFPWDRRGKGNEESSCWVRVSQNWAGKRWGAMFLPRIGQEVIVEYLEGDPDHPIVTGRVYNGESKPPYALPANATMSTIKSNSSKGGGGFNEIRFEDKKGEEQIFIHGEKQLDVRINKSAYEWVGESRHLIVKKDQLEKIENNRHETVTNDHTEKIGKDRHLKVVGKQAVEVGGSHSLTVTGDVVEVFKANHSEQVTQNYYVKAMGVVIEATSGITLKCGGNSIVLDPSGVTIKGTMVCIDGSMTRINSGPGSPPTPGVAGQAVSPASPTEPEEADQADPGEMAQVKARKLEMGKGKYGAVPVTPYVPPPPPSESGNGQDEQPPPPKKWVEVELVDNDGNPVAGEPFEVKLPDGRVFSGTLDGSGKARVDGIDPGNCEITFPNYDQETWNK